MNKKMPLRMCMACRQKMHKKDLIKIVKDANGQIKVDEHQKLDGRGAYICYKESCHKTLHKRKLLNKTFSTNVSNEAYEQVEKVYKTQT